MKAIVPVCMTIFALGAATAMGQYIDNRASTVGESRARGMSDVIRSQGAANLANSQAAVNMTEAVSRDIENRDQWTDTYFQMREKNRDYRAAERGPRATEEDFVRYAAAGKPDRLSPSQLDSVSGQIKWPRVLTRPEFDESRAELESLFAKRAAYGDVTWDDYTRISTVVDQAQAELKKIIREVPSSDYMAGKRFLESLDYENRQPA